MPVGSGSTVSGSSERQPISARRIVARRTALTWGEYSWKRGSDRPRRPRALRPSGDDCDLARGADHPHVRAGLRRAVLLAGVQGRPGPEGLGRLGHRARRLGDRTVPSGVARRLAQDVGGLLDAALVVRHLHARDDEPLDLGRALEGGQRVRGAAGGGAGAGALELLLELPVAAEQVVHRHAAVLEDYLGGLRGADAELRLLLPL